MKRVEVMSVLEKKKKKRRREVKGVVIANCLFHGREGREEPGGIEPGGCWL